MKTYSLNPVVSVKVLDNLSLAAGFDVMWSKVILKRKTPVVIRGRVFPDGEVRSDRRRERRGLQLWDALRTPDGGEAGGCLPQSN